MLQASLDALYGCLQPAGETGPAQALCEGRPLADIQADILMGTQWPKAVGYAPWVEEIWVNYLSNGIKYGGSSPRLEVGGETLADGRARFWVKDNGPGIDPENQVHSSSPIWC